MAGNTAATAVVTASIDHGTSIVISFNPHDTLQSSAWENRKKPLSPKIETTGLVALCRSDAR